MKKLTFNSFSEKKSFLNTSGITSQEIIDSAIGTGFIIIDSEFPFENNARVLKCEVVA
jgi:hypothetical protein